MSYYLSEPILQFYYQELQNAGPLDNAVNNFWNNTLRHYFTQDQDKLYGIEIEQQPLPGMSKQHSGIAIRCIKNAISKKVVLFETQTPTWGEAADQLAAYFALVRVEQPAETLYGAVAIGTYVRFYYLDVGKTILIDYPTVRTGDAFELLKDEEVIHRVLLEFVQKTSS